MTTDRPTSSGGASARRRPAGAAALLAALLAVLVAGCGGGGAEPTAGGKGGSGQTAVGQSDGLSPGAQPAGRGAGARITAADRKGRKVMRARFPGGKTERESGIEARPAAGNPCRLVTRAEAAAATGRRVVRQTAAPQGPTCVIQLARTKQLVTVVLGRADVAAARKHGKTLAARRIAGRPARCIRFGAIHTYVTLGRGRVLDITAPCPAGAALAATALTRVGR